MLTSCLTDIENAAKIMTSASNNNKILWCGNGGSAADAQHMSAELMGGLRSHDRPAVASIALTTDSSFITAWANDT
ncbi:MAG: SIS domain-containing protein, partial [Candidatus Marinimicrobia bacterium]|nr:SIS domain-containing protein [Candidatus Neomarinimicrobiota bacterium]